jgi:hypothetical protein
MLRRALPAAGPTGTVGRVRATQDLHCAVRSGTAGCGLNLDHGPCTGRGSYASTHAHLGGTAGRETLWGSLAASGPEELRDSEREATRRRMHISAPPAARSFWGLLAAEELRDSERTCASMHAYDAAYLGTAGRGTRKGTVGCERAGRAA